MIAEEVMSTETKNPPVPKKASESSNPAVRRLFAIADQLDDQAPAAEQDAVLDEFMRTLTSK
jgi:hypothetical protein